MLVTPACNAEASGEDGSDPGSCTSGKNYLTQRRRDKHKPLLTGMKGIKGMTFRFNVQRSTFNVNVCHPEPWLEGAIPVSIIAVKPDLTGMKGMKGIKYEIQVIA